MGATIKALVQTQEILHLPSPASPASKLSCKARLPYVYTAGYAMTPSFRCQAGSRRPCLAISFSFVFFGSFFFKCIRAFNQIKRMQIYFSRMVKNHSAFAVIDLVSLRSCLHTYVLLELMNLYMYTQKKAGREYCQSLYKKVHEKNIRISDETWLRQ